MARRGRRSARRDDGTGADLPVPRGGFVGLPSNGDGTERRLVPAELPTPRAPEGFDDLRRPTAQCPDDTELTP